MLGSVLRSSLNTGETLARFQAFGNIPVVIQRFIIKVKLLVTMGDTSFRRRAEMLSIPLALLLQSRNSSAVVFHFVAVESGQEHDNFKS